MWQMRMDMSRDECRKCLRCLELDAYGNMVSVLRAQGPFTEDKKRLLEELAKVLHISNERHRAEVRRAANDEKLSIIAEQLNGPNTWTDWAIEGRRTIPLLPRLKAHTAFTGLANSLSLVIATANEKKVPFEEKRPEPLVKAEIDLNKDLVQPEKNPQKPQPKTRGRKRKKSLPEISQDLRNPKLSTRDMNNHGAIVSTIINDLSSDLKSSRSSLPSESIEVDKSTSEDLEKSPKNYTQLPENKIHNNSSTKPMNCQLEINRTPEAAIKSDNNEMNPEDLDLKNDEETINNELDRINIEEEILEEDLLDVERIKSTNETINPVISSLEEISQDNSESGGSGPLEDEDKTIKINNSKGEMLNNQSRIEKGIKLNSNNSVNISKLKNTRLKGKTNIIMVKKGMKLSHAGKDLFKKIIIDDNLRISTKPQLPNNNEMAPNSNTKSIKTVELDIRQDELPLDNHNEDSFEPVDDIKTNSIDLNDEQSQDCGNNDVNSEEIEGRDEDLDDEQSNDISDENCVEETIEITEETISDEILIEHDNETILIDAQTEIFNFESTDDNVCEIQMEETIPTSTQGLFTPSEDLTLENYEEETESSQLNQLDS